MVSWGSPNDSFPNTGRSFFPERTKKRKETLETMVKAMVRKKIAQRVAVVELVPPHKLVRASKVKGMQKIPLYFPFGIAIQQTNH